MMALLILAAALLPVSVAGPDRLPAHAGLLPLRTGLRNVGGGGPGASEPVRERHAGGRVPLPPLPHLPAAGVLGWRQPDGGALRSDRGGRLGLPRLQQPRALRRQDRPRGGHRLRFARLHQAAQRPPLGLSPRPTGPTCGWATPAFRFALHRPGLSSTSWSKPARARSSTTSVAWCWAAPEDAAKVFPSRTARPGALPAARRAHPGA